MGQEEEKLTKWLDYGSEEDRAENSVKFYTRNRNGQYELFRPKKNWTPVIVVCLVLILGTSLVILTL